MSKEKIIRNFHIEFLLVFVSVIVCWVITLKGMSVKTDAWMHGIYVVFLLYLSIQAAMGTLYRRFSKLEDYEKEKKNFEF